MFSTRLSDFESYADEGGFISALKMEEVIRKNFGYAFNRQSLNKLRTGYFHSATKRDIDIIGKRVKYSKKILLDVIVYLMLGESLIGMLKGNVRKDREAQLDGVSTLSSKFFSTIRQVTYTADIRQENIPDIAPSGDAPDDYEPTVHRYRPLHIDARLDIGYLFLHKWLHNENYDSFYDDWHIFRNRVLCEDHLAEEEVDEEGPVFCSDTITPSMLPFKDGAEFSIPIYNRYEIRKEWSCRNLKSIGNFHNKGGASIGSSIAILDSFIKSANPEDVEKLRDWMEIILTFENGSGWIVDEAKAKLKHDIKLDQDSLIDDWWLLSFIYLRTIENLA